MTTMLDDVRGYLEMTIPKVKNMLTSYPEKVYFACRRLIFFRIKQKKLS